MLLLAPGRGGALPACGRSRPAAHHPHRDADRQRAAFLTPAPPPPRPQAVEGRYVGYPAHPTDAASLGQPLGAFATLALARQACDALASCNGFKFAHSDPVPWKTFGGKLWEGVTGKVRLTGESIDPWVAAVALTR
jgi:hypothetical protein